MAETALKWDFLFIKVFGLEVSLWVETGSKDDLKLNKVEIPSFNSRQEG